MFSTRLSDYITRPSNSMKLKFRFLGINERHHSVAIASVNALPINPIRTRVQHVNVQVAPSMTCSLPTSGSSNWDSRWPYQSASTPTTTNCPTTHEHPQASNRRSAGISSSSTNPPGNPPVIRESASRATSPKGKPSSPSSSNSPLPRGPWFTPKTPSPRSAHPPLPISIGHPQSDPNSLCLIRLTSERDHEDQHAVAPLALAGFAEKQEVRPRCRCRPAAPYVSSSQSDDTASTKA